MSTATAARNGALARTSVLESEAEVARREADLVRSRALERIARDNLRALINARNKGADALLMVAPADDTPHGRAVTALTDAVDRHPEAALRTLRHWLKDGASEEAA